MGWLAVLGAVVTRCGVRAPSTSGGSDVRETEIAFRRRVEN